MGFCGICEKLIEDENDDIGCHKACDDIYWQRVRDKICTHCGENPITNPPLYCSQCNINSPYKNYHAVTKSSQKIINMQSTNLAQPPPHT